MPNSLPGRNNVEIEIYGMEGIPEEDQREHEKQKIGKGGRPCGPGKISFALFLFVVQAQRPVKTYHFSVKKIVTES